MRRPYCHIRVRHLLGGQFQLDSKLLRRLGRNSGHHRLDDPFPKDMCVLLLRVKPGCRPNEKCCSRRIYYFVAIIVGRADRQAAPPETYTGYRQAERFASPDGLVRNTRKWEWPRLNYSVCLE